MPSHAATAVAAGLLGGVSLEAGATPDATVLEETSRLLTSGVPMRMLRSGPHASTPLHEMCRRGQHGMLRVVVSLNVLTAADINARDNQGRTPLMLAAGSASKMAGDCVALLLKHGADLNAVDNHGETVLHYAAVSAENIALLLRGKSMPSTTWINACSKQPRLRTALLKAVYYGAREAVAELLRAGANPNIPDGDRRLAMDLCEPGEDTLHDPARHRAIKSTLEAYKALSTIKHGAAPSIPSSLPGASTTTATAAAGISAAGASASSVGVVHR